jgi:hypothetical protein
MKIAVFYHCLFYHGNPAVLRVPACEIIAEQVSQMEQSGLADACDELIVGINGPVEESRDVARMFLPGKAKLVMHGPDSFAENLTIVEIEKWVPAHPGWLVLYFHAKGCSHPDGSDYAERVSKPWRRAMMHHLVTNWRQCVSDLESGAEAVGCNWLTGQGWDHSQNIFAGNFFWATARFLLTLPSIYARERIKTSGIASAESRYEAEVWIGNGPRLPLVKVYHPGGL